VETVGETYIPANFVDTPVIGADKLGVVAYFEGEVEVEAGE
jgi:hypothetical protein